MTGAASGALAFGLLTVSNTSALADQVFNDDVIITFSLCVGNDCNNGESFGFDTLRLKENNLRIHFDDTSNSASFPQNDWRILANETTNGGRSFLAIEDATAGRIPFRVEAGAPTHSLVVEADGDVGIKTLEPVVDLHIVEGNTPTVRLEQDGSDGFTPQTWDVAGNEANFFIRDVTNGSRLSFKIKPGAPENSLFIANDGDIGLGTQTPVAGANLDVNSGAASTIIALSNNNFTWEFKTNVNTGRFSLGAVGLADPFKVDETAVENLLQVGINATDEVTVTGNLVVSGDCTEQNGACADYVFEPDYKLRSLDELQKFITSNKHLPNVPSADEMKKNGVSVTHLSGRLLEKIEELVLYTLEQQETIDELRARLDKVESKG